jgi:hypothetical protein
MQSAEANYSNRLNFLTKRIATNGVNYRTKIVFSIKYSTILNTGIRGTTRNKFTLQYFII